MPSYTALFEDSSPFLRYSAGWETGTATVDRLVHLYSEGSFMVTERQGETLDFSFYGTGFGIYGAKRLNHGRFSINVDGTPYEETGIPPLGSPPTGSFNSTLFSLSGLRKGFHEVILTNLEPRFRDIDYVSWEASIGLDDEPLIVNTVQDSHPAWTYEPSDAWTDRPPTVGRFAAGTGHATSLPEATASLSFQVHAIAIYGPAGPDCASSYRVDIDSRPVNRTFNALKPIYRPRQLLFYGANLGPGAHVVSLSLSGGSQSQGILAIDYAEVYTTPSLNGSFSPLQGSIVRTSPCTQSLSSTPVPLGMVVGVSLVSGLAASTIVILGYLILLYKRGNIHVSSMSVMKVAPYSSSSTSANAESTHAVAVDMKTRQRHVGMPSVDRSVPGWCGPPIAEMRGEAGTSGKSAQVGPTQQHPEGPPPAYPASLQWA
ncbi:hypothetical protein FA15DRAFT_672065 [Coprinopsis marcescibilis]|uniref:Transmembrane protein n=1 Tax=Coprinopsis marcescibilis TaxID=230819 RepID=A0A5C3KNR4_COPMA|nr:hypothetical protein FA15DRAFT_672065 [Coprinopsis marcescibilis]